MYQLLNSYLLKIELIIKQVDPFPFVPATWIEGKFLCGLST